MHHDADPDEFSGDEKEEPALPSGSESAPAHTGWRSNWADPVDTADAFVAAAQPGEAVALLQALIAGGRAGLLARVALINAQLAANDIPGAVEAARETVALYPGTALAAIGLGKALLAAGFLPAAIGEFQRALRIDRDLVEAQFQLGTAWLEGGEPEKALSIFSELPERAHAGLAAKIAEAQAMCALPRSNSRYVRHLFDQFSATYDARMLGPLSYAGHAILRQLADLVLPVKENLRVLDLGCGTGLAGAAFRDMAAMLDGIDLSPAIVERARERGVYDSLAVGDIENIGETDMPGYDLIVAADTLVYLGDLGPLFAVVARRLSPGGHFLFTVEKSQDAEFALGPKRRWQHSGSYLRALAAGAGLDVRGLIDCIPRHEAGKAVEGLAAALSR